MKPIIVTCPGCQQKIRITQKANNGCKCGVIIGVYHGSESEMIESIKESWDYCERIEAKPHPVEGHEAFEFNLGGDLQIVAVKYGETWVAFQDCD